MNRDTSGMSLSQAASMTRGEAFRRELAALLNSHSMENGSDTPDYILAEFLLHALVAFNETVRTRETWYGRTPQRATAGLIGGPNAAPQAPCAPRPTMPGPSDRIAPTADKDAAGLAERDSGVQPAASAPSDKWERWRNVRPWDLEPYYLYWVSHLTSEDLHAKSDIATVLALLHQQRDDLESDYMRLLREKQDRLEQARHFDLTGYINAADISGADAPHTVVEKLQRAINARPA